MDQSCLYLTGGIATGKSTCRRILEELTSGVRFFDADQSVHGILTRPDVIATISSLFGQGVLDEQGQIDRALLRTKVFEDPELRLQLEEILHPRVFEDFQETLAEVGSSTEAPSHMIAEIPLLFESTRNYPDGQRVVVACEQDLQLSRLSSRGWSEDDAQGVIGAQMPIEEKVTAADYVIWSSLSLESARRQLLHLARHLGLSLS